MKKDKEWKSNEEFISELNEELGNIITPDMQEGILYRASYSFENLYNKILSGKISKKLLELNVPEENLSTETKRVFLYIRMMKNISMINSKAISGEQLDYLIDESISEYSLGMNFFEQHSADEGITYKQMKSMMKEYVASEKEKRLSTELQQDEPVNQQEDEMLEGEKVAPKASDGEVQDAKLEKEAFKEGQNPQQGNELSETVENAQTSNELEDVELNEQQSEESQQEAEGQAQNIDEDPLVEDMRKFIALRNVVKDLNANKKEFEIAWSESNKKILELQNTFEEVKEKIATLSPSDLQGIKDIFDEMTQITEQINEWSGMKEQQEEKLKQAKAELAQAQEENRE